MAPGAQLEKAKISSGKAKKINRFIVSDFRTKVCFYGSSLGKILQTARQKINFAAASPVP
jgi:hypothetical protein